MTEIPPVSVPPAEKPRRRPFSQLRVDPQKAVDGVWIKHPETADELRTRRLWCAEHIRAMEQATIDYESKHGPESAQTKEGSRIVEAVAIATGLVIDWRIAGQQDHPYDAAEMTALLLDPAYADLSPWIRVQASQRVRFQTEHVTGN